MLDAAALINSANATSALRLSTSAVPAQSCMTAKQPQMRYFSDEMPELAGCSRQYQVARNCTHSHLLVAESNTLSAYSNVVAGGGHDCIMAAYSVGEMRRYRLPHREIDSQLHGLQIAASFVPPSIGSKWLEQKCVATVASRLQQVVSPVSAAPQTAVDQQR